jgi:hypothetical protein
MISVDHENLAAADRSRDDHATTDGDVLTEHSGKGNGQFSRADSTSFSTEDRTALKHVATVIAVLLGVALVLGVIAATA